MPVKHNPDILSHLNGRVMVVFMKPPSISPQLLTQPSTGPRPPSPDDHPVDKEMQEMLDIIDREFMSHAEEILGPPLVK